MSTRCQIVVKGNETAKIYKHSDGYPEGVMPVLTELLQQFIPERGEDHEYCTAQIIRAFARDDERHRVEMLEAAKANGTQFLIENYSKPSMLSWGVSDSWHWDIAFYYLVDLVAGEVLIYEPAGKFYDAPCIENMTLNEKVKVYPPSLTRVK